MVQKQIVFLLPLNSYQRRQKTVSPILLQQKDLVYLFLQSTNTIATKEQQIEFLKKHEDKMTEYVKKQEFYITSENEKKHAKVEKVNFDFGSITAYERDAGGIKTGVYTIEIMGFYNEKEENSFDLLVNVNSLKEPTKILGFERY